MKGHYTRKRNTFDDRKSDMEAAVVVKNLADKLRETNATLGDVEE